MNYDKIMKTYNELFIDFIDTICYNRPVPNREYDQIYMHGKDMIKQALHVASFFKGKDIVFLGDGDGMSILFTLMIEYGIIEPFNKILVLDFDERILKNCKKIISNTTYGKTKVEYCLYNIINPIPNKYLHAFDAFYINPPYGSKNEGLSCKLWLYRCFALCKKDLRGCMILPNDNKREWTQQNLTKILNFLENLGLSIFDIKPESHGYFLEDNPDLLSTSVLVKGQLMTNNIYETVPFTYNQVENLYGEPRAIPKYIYDDTLNIKGVKDFSWEYGHLSR